MFSKELLMMDHNTTRLMIDDLTTQVKEKGMVIAEMIAEKEAALAEKDRLINTLRQQLKDAAK